MMAEQSEPSLIDAHCHIDLFPKPADLVTVIDEQRIHTIAVTNAPFVFRHTQALATKSPFLHAALGLHPELIATHGSQLDQMLTLLCETRFVGEVGLDYCTTDHSLRDRQVSVFTRILEECAKLGDKVITVHSRRAARDVIAAVGPKFPGRVILHWFSGTRADVRKAISYGLWFSVNHAMTQSANGCTILSELPPDQVLTETDGPFLKVSGRAQTPSDVATVLPALATLWKVDQREARRIVADNFERLLQTTENHV